MSTIILVVLAATALTVSGTPSFEKTPSSADVLTERTPHRLPSYSRFTLGAKTRMTVRTEGPIPWRCFTKKGDKMCSCTILSHSFVLAKRSCMKNDTKDVIEVYAGATNEGNASQIIRATLLNTTEPPPEGVVALKLDTKLEFNSAVANVKLVDRNHDNRFGFVSGFRYNNGSYQLEYYPAAILENLCSEGLCVVGHQWPPSDSSESKATDFLDYYDDVDEDVYFIGVLNTHYSQSFATYYKAKDMIPWIQKHLTGVVDGNVPCSGYEGNGRDE